MSFGGSEARSKGTSIQSKSMQSGGRGAGANFSAYFSIILVALLDEFNLVSFGRVDESKNSAGAGGRRPIRKWVPFSRGVFGKGFQIRHFESQMRKIRADHHWPA